MPFRLSAFLVCASLFSSAHATFDMMLLGDNTTAGNQRVVRYDPINRVVLGSFGQGFLNDNIVDIAVDQATNRAFVVQDTGGVRVFNYNTGEYLSSFAPNSAYNNISFDSTLGHLIFANGSGGFTNPGRTYNTSGSVVGSMVGNMSTAGIRHPSGGSFFASWGVNGADVVAIRHTNATSASPLATTGAYTFASGNAPVQGLFVGNSFLGLAKIGTDLRIYSVLTDPGNFVGGPVSALDLGAATGSFYDMANGHGSLIYVQDGNKISTISMSPNVMNLGTQTLSFATSANIRGMAMVVAPEPATLISLGIGIGAMIRKRRTRKS